MDSRWSCKPDLGPDGSTCSITYTLAEPLDVVGLNIGEFLVPSVFNKHGVQQYFAMIGVLSCTVLKRVETEGATLEVTLLSC